MGCSEGPARSDARYARAAGGGGSIAARIAMLWLTTLLAWPSSGGAREIEGVEFADRASAGELTLELKSVGLLRYMVFFKAYVAGLYMGPDVMPSQVLADQPKRLEIHYFYPITRDQFTTSTAAAIRQNVGDERFEQIRSSVERFNALYRDVQPGDRYALTYLPGLGTELALNGEALGIVEGSDFAEAVFSIWFGSSAIDADLKKALLGPG